MIELLIYKLCSWKFWTVPAPWITFAAQTFAHMFYAALRSTDMQDAAICFEANAPQNK